MKLWVKIMISIWHNPKLGENTSMTSEKNSEIKYYDKES